MIPLLVVLPLFLGAALAVYAPCLSGPFLSDDHFILFNPFVATLAGPGGVIEILKPFGEATAMISEYRPLWFLLHAIEWQTFGDAVAGYHVANVVLHALASALLVLLFARSGLPMLWAAAGGALFLVHPANVEGVAWVSQLGSPVTLALVLGALLLEPTRPATALALFALGLLTKPSAAVALPVAALFLWVEGDARPWLPGGRTRWPWLAGWLAVLVAYASVELTAFRAGRLGVEALHADGAVVARTIVANALRYFVMAGSGFGLSAFHQAQPALSWLDPWWLGGVALLALLGGRLAITLARRRPEGVYWAWAALAFAPVSQVVPFTHPVADRYLYFILPGLLGGTLFAARAALARSRDARRVAAAAAVALAVVLAVQAHARAGLWVSFDALAADSTRHYPDGMWAHLMRSRNDGTVGDAARSAAELRAAFERGYRGFDQVQRDPAWQRVLPDPRFQAVVRDIAQWWITLLGERDDLSQLQLYQLASAHWYRGEAEDTARVLERALAVGGPLDARIRAELPQIKARVTPQ